MRSHDDRSRGIDGTREAGRCRALLTFQPWKAQYCMQEPESTMPPAGQTGHDHAHHTPSAHAHGDRDHARAATAARPAPKSDQSEVEYTCPMHPQVRQIGPGNCPICGMALEPVLASAETGESP